MPHGIIRSVAVDRVEETKTLLLANKTVYVHELSKRLDVSAVSVRKYLARLEREGVATRFYGGASLVEPGPSDGPVCGCRTDPVRDTLARAAIPHISDGDSIFVGSGRTCCALARYLFGFSDLTVVTNNISAIEELTRNVSRVYLIGGEVTTTDNRTLFSSWEQPQSPLRTVHVNKAFTSISGIDLEAGLTVDSIISTHIFAQIPSVARRWYLVADSTKFDRISIHSVAELGQIDTVITDTIPPPYADRFRRLGVEVVVTNPD